MNKENKKMRLIDAEKILDVLNEMHNMNLYPNEVNFASFVVKDAKEIDAVPVVRCKDCKNKDDETINDNLVFCYMTGTRVSHNGYCYLGKEKEKYERFNGTSYSQNIRYNPCEECKKQGSNLINGKDGDIMIKCYDCPLSNWEWLKEK